MPPTETYRLRTTTDRYFEATGAHAATRISRHVLEMEERAASRAAHDVRVQLVSEDLAPASTPARDEDAVAPPVSPHQASPRPGARAARRSTLDLFVAALGIFFAAYIAVRVHDPYWEAAMVLVGAWSVADLVSQKTAFYLYTILQHNGDPRS